MQPVNAFKSLVNRNLKKLSLRRSTLAQHLGYRNTTKGLRRIDALLNAELDDEALLRRVAKVLMIPRWEFERALEDRRARQEKQRREEEATARAKFRPSLTLISPESAECFMSRFAQLKTSQVPLPAFEAGLTGTWEQERAEVLRCFHAHLHDRVESGNPKPHLAGFYYHRLYDHGFLFDCQGHLMREDHHHVAPSSITSAPTFDIEW